jgi:hypothetical protein
MKAILIGHARPLDDKLRHHLFDAWKDAILEAGDSWERYNNLNSEQFGDVSISWGIRRLEIGVQTGHYSVIMEMGFLGDRSHKNFYVGYSGLNGMGKPLLPAAPDRGAPYYERLKPMKSLDSKRVLIMGQVRGDTNLVDFGPDNSPGRRLKTVAWWKSQVRHWIQRGYEVGFKPHPHDPISKSTAANDWGVRMFDTLESAFDWGGIAVAYNSNSLVDAALAGLHVIPAHAGSLTWPIRSTPGALRNLTEAERRSWLDYVASYQWSPDQFTTAWRAIKYGHA